jgi:acyl dehydratase
VLSRRATGALTEGRGGVLFLPSVGLEQGRYFEDIEIGDEYVSPGRTVTESDIVIFAGLSGDYNVLHTDAEHMKSSIFGERIAHGLLGLSIQHGLLRRSMTRTPEDRFVGLKWKFKGPIKIGDTVHVRARVIAKKDVDEAGWGLVTMERAVVNQSGAVVQEGETDHLIARRAD